MTTVFTTMESGVLPMKRGRIIKTMADSTVRNTSDAIVELVTNSDDSYSRMEQEGHKVSGRIDINISKGKGGHCKEIIVTDEAGGMDYQTLKKAIEFSGETSGFQEGKSVRGFFGRGLKESIIALGIGTILTLKDNVLSRATIYYDEKGKDAIFELNVPIQNLTEEELLEFGFIGKSGTIVKIEVTNTKKDYVEGKDTLGTHLTNLSSLREVNSSSKRTVFLHLAELDRADKFRLSTPLHYVMPEGKSLVDETFQLDDGDVHFRIYESKEQLDSPRNPYGRAGLLIKTEGAILDNQLFGFETDPTALYFFGEIICPGIAKIIRTGDESIVDFNRGGLDWRHPYNQKLETLAKETLKKLVAKKKEELKLEKQAVVSTPVEKMLEKLCKKLGDLAKNELEDSEPNRGDIDSFMIRPLFANIEPGSPRTFTVYVPKYLVDGLENSDIIEIKSSNENVKLAQKEIKLEQHKKFEDILKANFKVVGDIEGEESSITASLGGLYANCEVKVAPFGERGPVKPPKGGRLFNKIVPANDENPIQRFEYVEGGTLRIYMKFPGVEDYLGENFIKVSTPEGKLLLAEILIEAFCRYISRKRAGKNFNEEIDPLISDMDRLRKKATDGIYKTIAESDLKDLIGE